MTDSYPRETVEFLPVTVTVTVDGAVVTSGVKFCITPSNARPATWLDPVTLNGKIGVMIQNLDPGWYRTWAQVTDTPEIPVIDCGPFQVT